MKTNPITLLVHDRPAPLATVGSQLASQGSELRHARTCGEAAAILWSNAPPHVVLTDVSLPDGNWTDVLKLAEGAPEAVNVIVVSPFWEIGFYIDTVECGAFDFLAPPFVPDDVLLTVQSAIANALYSRRQPARQRTPTRAGADPGQAAGTQAPDDLERPEVVEEERDS